ncbi:MAG: SDR family NAD(P)-dependent oxidoreductase, partial [Pseudomonadota bacterium]|nr:SDR family NAD(P)-dependent oxidoreductase [Pseudomonadota bacterium]
MGLLDGKSAIVTGAGSGIGRAAARRFAAEGASVVLVSRRAAPLEALAEEIAAAGGTALPCPGDVTDPAAAESAVALATARFGGLDIAFDNAG